MVVSVRPSHRAAATCAGGAGVAAEVARRSPGLVAALARAPDAANALGRALDERHHLAACVASGRPASCGSGFDDARELLVVDDETAETSSAKRRRPLVARNTTVRVRSSSGARSTGRHTSLGPPSRRLDEPLAFSAAEATASLHDEPWLDRAGAVGRKRAVVAGLVRRARVGGAARVVDPDGRATRGLTRMAAGDAPDAGETERVAGARALWSLAFADEFETSSRGALDGAVAALALAAASPNAETRAAAAGALGAVVSRGDAPETTSGDDPRRAARRAADACATPGTLAGLASVMSNVDSDPHGAVAAAAATSALARTPAAASAMLDPNAGVLDALVNALHVSSDDDAEPTRASAAAHAAIAIGNLASRTSSASALASRASGWTSGLTRLARSRFPECREAAAGAARNLALAPEGREAIANAPGFVDAIAALVDGDEAGARVAAAGCVVNVSGDSRRALALAATNDEPDERDDVDDPTTGFDVLFALARTMPRRGVDGDLSRRRRGDDDADAAERRRTSRRRRRRRVEPDSESNVVAVASVGAATATTTETIFEATTCRAPSARRRTRRRRRRAEALAKLAACLARVDGARRRSERVSSECSGRSFSRFRRAFASTTRAASATLDACLDAAAAAVSAEDDASNPRWNATMSVAARACAAIRAVATLATNPNPDPESCVAVSPFMDVRRTCAALGILAGPRRVTAGADGLSDGFVSAEAASALLATARADRREWTHAVVDAALDGALLDRVRVAVAEEKERGETIREDARGEIRDAAPRDAASSETPRDAALDAAAAASSAGALRACLDAGALDETRALALCAPGAGFLAGATRALATRGEAADPKRAAGRRVAAFLRVPSRAFGEDWTSEGWTSGRGAYEDDASDDASTTPRTTPSNTSRPSTRATCEALRRLATTSRAAARRRRRTDASRATRRRGRRRRRGGGCAGRGGAYPRRARNRERRCSSTRRRTRGDVDEIVRCSHQGRQ